MTWIKLDDDFPDHPKVVAAGVEGGWLYVCGLCYCGRYLTDGFIPRAMLRRLTDIEAVEDAAARLVAVGLWDAVEGGWNVHDYTEKQSTKAQVEAARAGNAERQSRHRSRSSNGVSNGVTDGVSVSGVRASEDRSQKTDKEQELEHRAPSFDDWYAIYPRKKDPRAARKAWDSAVKRHGAQEIVDRSIPHFAAFNAWATEDRQYIPYPATFLNRDGFLGEVEQRKATATKQAMNRLRLLAQLAEARGRTSIEGTPALDTTAKETRL